MHRGPGQLQRSPLHIQTQQLACLESTTIVKNEALEKFMNFIRNCKIHAVQSNLFTIAYRKKGVLLKF
jgi:hypothetical protein